jgi:membrane fusion protein (multidrug efflux system)
MNTDCENQNIGKSRIPANGYNARPSSGDANLPDTSGDHEADTHAESMRSLPERLEALRHDPAGDTGARSGSTKNLSEPPPRQKRPKGRIALFAIALVAAGALSPFVWNYLQSYESTDDAQIDGHIDPLSSRIDGTVIAVHAEDDDRVKKGDLIVEIDPRDYQVAVEQANAKLDLARAQVASSRQEYSAALATVREDEASNFKAQRDSQRYSSLFAEKVVALEQYDQYTAIAKVSAAKLDSDREAAGSALKTIAAREADANAAKAVLDQALLNLSYTRIYAPANGIVGKRGVQLGSRIQPGQTLMFVTETDDVWVIANFKETQLARMHPGQSVTVHVDTFGRNYRAHVENMPGASGDRFSLLPSENATGNYVKVVQRLPVRIKFEPGQDSGHSLHPGMSVEPTVWLQ